MVCPNCGKQVPDGQAVCPFCGEPLDDEPKGGFNMSVWKLISGVLSILVAGFILFLKISAGLGNIMPKDGDVSVLAELIVAVLLLINALTSILGRRSIAAGNMVIALVCGLGASAALLLTGWPFEMLVAAGWCALCLLLALVCLLINGQMKTVLKIVAFALVFALGVGTGKFSRNVALPGPDPTVDREPQTLVGDWKAVGDSEDGSGQVAVITADKIEIYWVNGGGGTKSLYWSGSFTAPEELEKSYSWISENDRSKTGSAPMASSEETKEFTYKSGKLSYTVSILGTTQKMKLEKQIQP